MTQEQGKNIGRKKEQILSLIKNSNNVLWSQLHKGLDYIFP